MPPAATGSGASAPTGIATGSAHGRLVAVDRVLEVGDRQERRRVGHARPGADERRLEDAGVGPAPDDDDVVGARSPRPSSLDDRVEDRVRRDRAGQARTGCGRTISASSRRPTSSAGDGLAVADGGDADDERRGRRSAQSTGRRARPATRSDGDQAEDEERGGEDPPGPSDPTIRRVRGSRRRGWVVRSRRDQRMAVRSPRVHPDALVLVASGTRTSYYGRRRSCPSARRAGAPRRRGRRRA